MMGFFAYIEQFYLGKILATFLTAMLPVLELRASVPLGISLGLDYRLVFFLSVLGNMIPVPFIIVLITKIMDFLALRSARFAAFKAKLYGRAEDRWEQVKKMAALRPFHFGCNSASGHGGLDGRPYSCPHRS